jgi:peptide chain release factor 1
MHMDDQEKKLRDEYTELEAKLQDPDIFSSKQYPAMAKRFGELNRLIILFDEQRRLSKQLADEKGMSQGIGELAELAREEARRTEELLGTNEAMLYEALLPKDSNDERDCIVEIRAAAGGDEASLFAGAYQRKPQRSRRL